MLVRGQTNAVFRLPAESAWAKIARFGTPAERVEQKVRLVRWLMDAGFPPPPSTPSANNRSWSTAIL